MLSERSYKLISIEDLKSLQTISLKEKKDFIIRNPESKINTEEPIAIALCQGAAMHFVKLTSGIKDFDIYFFYQNHYVRRCKQIDSYGYNLDKFGINPADKEKGYKGRRIDFIKRALKLNDEKDPIKAIIFYLKNGETNTAQELVKKAVVGIWPDSILGKVIWPENSQEKYKKSTGVGH